MHLHLRTVCQKYFEDRLLVASDTQVPADAPEGYASAWRTYRQKLRDLPATWASVGDNTYLIVWPREPGDVELFQGDSPETGLDSKASATAGN